jgi:hypothetical protein
MCAQSRGSEAASDIVQCSRPQSLHSSWQQACLNHSHNDTCEDSSPASHSTCTQRPPSKATTPADWLPLERRSGRAGVRVLGGRAASKKAGTSYGRRSYGAEGRGCHRCYSDHRCQQTLNSAAASHRGMAPQVLREGVGLGRRRRRLLLLLRLCCSLLWHWGCAFEPPCRQRHVGGCLPNACVNTFLAESIPRPFVINGCILSAEAGCRRQQAVRPSKPQTLSHSWLTTNDRFTVESSQWQRVARAHHSPCKQS